MMMMMMMMIIMHVSSTICVLSYASDGFATHY